MKHQGERRRLCVEIGALKERLFRAGLYRTGHLIDKACQEIGYECAEQFDRETKYGLKEGPCDKNLK